jgi:hypothetical protein
MNFTKSQLFIESSFILNYNSKLGEGKKSIFACLMQLSFSPILVTPALCRPVRRYHFTLYPSWHTIAPFDSWVTFENQSITELGNFVPLW